MMRFRRLLALAAVTVTTVAVAPLAGGLTSASAKNVAPDGGPMASPSVNADPSMVPTQVRSGAAQVVAPLNAAQHLRVTLGIKSRNAAAAAAFNQAVQNRNSPLFHKYLTAAEWNARFAPSVADEQAVVDWAKSNGLTVTHRFPNRMLVDVDATASALESALHVSINQYSLNGKAVFSNANQPVLPGSINAIVSSVDGLNNVATLSTSSPENQAPMKAYSAGPVVQSVQSAHGNGSAAKLKTAMAAKKGGPSPSITGGSYDPTDIYSSQAYDEDALHNQSSCCNPAHLAGGTPPETSIAIVTAGAHDVNDIVGFHNRYTYLAYNYNEIYIDGTPSCCDGEGQMDLEWSTALSNSFGSFLDTAHVWLYSGVNPQFSTFNDMYNQVLTDGHAKIVSSSWGCAEVFCTSDGTMNTEHAIFDAMIGQGYTLLNASDDKGAFADCVHKSVSFPASDPDWLGISATNLELDASSNFVSEQAWPANSSGCANNGGGGGGGCSVKYAAPGYQLSPVNPNYFCNNGTTNMRSVPDVSLNGDWFNSPQNLFFNGSWQGNGGTSIAAPEFAGYIAQQNAYLLTLGSICGLSTGTAPCAPLGQGGVNLYNSALLHAAGGRNPFYDTTSGCTSNDAGAGFCGITGYDRATGWGTVNMLQLAWSMNYWTVAEGAAPSVSIAGPPINTYVTSGTLSWSVADNGGSFAPSGVAGWTAKWDADPGNVTSHATPGAGDSFYSGPLSGHGSTTGSTSLAGAGEGCHTLYVRAWDNIGESGVSAYGPVCYDVTKPVVSTTPKVKLAANTSVTAAGVPVTITWAATDNASGVNNYTLQKSVDGGAFANAGVGLTTTSKKFNLPAGHTYKFQVKAVDNAGNASAFHSGAAFKITLYEENNGAITYTSGWARVAQTGASGGFVKDATVAGKKATFSFTGKWVAWVSTKGTTRGDASVVYDASAPKTVHTNGASTQAGRLLYVHSVATGTHSVAVSVVGTAGHPRVDVDAFVVIS